jgi:aldose 1-epimerase
MSTPASLTTAPPSGVQHEIAHGDQRAIITEVGATLRSYTVADLDVVDGFDVGDISSAGRGQILAPWPNRLEDGSYSRYGKEAHAALDEPERRNAIHGLVRWLPWSVRAQEENQVTLACVVHPQPGYPWRLELQVSYGLAPEGLTVTAAATNRSADPAPFGIGFHPYLTVGTLLDEAFLTVPARRHMATDERGLPTTDEAVDGTSFDFRGRRAISTTRMDTCFTDVIRGDDGLVRASVAGPDGRSASVWAGRGFDYLMIYTGDTLEPVLRRRHGIAIEPMTCPANAFRSGMGVIRLEPDRPWTGAWGIAQGTEGGERR